MGFDFTDQPIFAHAVFPRLSVVLNLQGMFLCFADCPNERCGNWETSDASSVAGRAWPVQRRRAESSISWMMLCTVNHPSDAASKHLQWNGLLVPMRMRSRSARPDRGFEVVEVLDIAWRVAGLVRKVRRARFRDRFSRILGGEWLAWNPSLYEYSTCAKREMSVPSTGGQAEMSRAEL